MLWRSVSPCKLLAAPHRARSNVSSWLNCDRSSACFTAQTFSKIARRGYGDFVRQQHAPGLPDLTGILRVSEEVSDAVATNRPVVALESTIYTHGALGSDLNLEAIVREHGSVPAVCGILNGIPTVGLTPSEVDLMVREGAKKASRRDLAYLIGLGMTGQQIHGGTTISGTMILARLAGIRVFGTGGLGGVHRGGEVSMDVSADLTELGRTRVAVISSGCKGFLDIPRTLEFLETQGVAVSTFADGRTGSVDFPAFWARDSGVKSPSVMQDEKQAAAVIFAQERLGVESGLLFANPIPQEHAISRQEMDAAINLAVREAGDKDFSGNENTPYILKRIKELTQGRSVPANKYLVQANVARASKIAVELSKLLAAPPAANSRTISFIQAGSAQQKYGHAEQSSEPSAKHDHPIDVLVAGSIALDLSCDYTNNGSGATSKSVSPAPHTSNPATITQSVGGVGYNVALAAHRIGRGTNVQLCSMVGRDTAGATVLSAVQATGLDTSCIRQLGNEHQAARTAQYVAVNDADKNLVLAMADMDILNSHSSPAHWATVVAAARPSWLVVDANWTAADIREWTSAGRAAGARIAFEPVSTAKSTRLFTPGGVGGLGVFPRHDVDLATPNQLELAAMHAAAREGEYLDSAAWFSVVDALGVHGGARDKFVRIAGLAATDAGVPVQSLQLLPFVPTIVAKMGAGGALLTQLLAEGDPRLRDPAAEPFLVARAPPGGGVGGVYMRAFPAAEAVRDAVSVNGVGDTFLGALVAGLAKGGNVDGLVDVAQRAAVMTLRSRESVSADLGLLAEDLERAVQTRQ